jgi:hypothetical protein
LNASPQHLPIKTWTTPLSEKQKWATPPHPSKNDHRLVYGAPEPHHRKEALSIVVARKICTHKKNKSGKEAKKSPRRATEHESIIQGHYQTGFQRQHHHRVPTRCNKTCWAVSKKYGLFEPASQNIIAWWLETQCPCSEKSNKI